MLDASTLKAILGKNPECPACVDCCDLGDRSEGAHYIAHGKLMQNGFVNGGLRDECLNKHLFADLDEAGRTGSDRPSLQRAPIGARARTDSF